MTRADGSDPDVDWRRVALALVDAFGEAEGVVAWPSVGQKGIMARELAALLRAAAENEADWKPGYSAELRAWADKLERVP